MEESSSTSISLLRDNYFSIAVIHSPSLNLSLPSAVRSLSYFVFPDEHTQKCILHIQGDHRRAVEDQVSSTFTLAVQYLMDSFRHGEVADETFIVRLQTTDFVFERLGGRLHLLCHNVSERFLRALEQENIQFETKKTSESHKTMNFSSSAVSKITAIDPMAINFVIDFICNEWKPTLYSSYCIYSTLAFPSGVYSECRVSRKVGSYFEIEGVIFGNRLFPLLSESECALVKTVHLVK